jgi:hypothetical protein
MSQQQLDQSTPPYHTTHAGNGNHTQHQPLQQHPGLSSANEGWGHRLEQQKIQAQQQATGL